MARPRVKELTQRELEVMQTFWQMGEVTVQAVRDEMDKSGRELAYTTVATLVRILCEKGFLEQTREERPFLFKPTRSFEDVSGSMVGDLVDRLFGGKREDLLLRLFDEGKLSAKERSLLQDLLREKKKS